MLEMYQVLSLASRVNLIDRQWFPVYLLRGSVTTCCEDYNWKKMFGVNQNKMLSKLGQNTYPDFYSWWSWFHLGTSVKNTIKFLVYLSQSSTWAPKIWQQWKSFSGNQSFTSCTYLPVCDMNQTFIERSDSALLIQIKCFLCSCFVYADSTDPLNEKGELRFSFIESGFITSSQIWYFCFYGSHSCF